MEKMIKMQDYIFRPKMHEVKKVFPILSYIQIWIFVPRADKKFELGTLASP